MYYKIRIDGLQNDNKTPFTIILLSEEIFFNNANKYGRPTQLNLIDFERIEGCSLIEFLNKSNCILSIHTLDHLIINLNKCAIRVHRIIENSTQTQRPTNN